MAGRSETEIKEWCKQIAIWREAKGFVTSKENMLEKLMLVVTELSEGVEAVRHGDWTNFSEEMADATIRIFDICGSIGIDLENEIAVKMGVNEQRPHMHGKLK